MSRRTNWEDQRAFLAVLEEGSLSAAARRLGVAQPTMRARIEALEHALGAVLFTRSVNGLVATAQAHALANPARAMARASDAFVRIASSQPGQIAGTVRLSVAELVGIEVVPPMLATLHATHPGIVVELSLSNTPADLLEQEVDIAVRMRQPLQGALVAKKIGTIKLGLFAHPDYLARKGTPQSLDNLASHNFIGPDRALADLQFAASLHPWLTREHFAVRTDSHPAQLALARAGLGIAVIQRPVGRADPLLRPVLPELEVGGLDTWIVAHEDLRDEPRVRAVFDHLVTGFTRLAGEKFVAMGQARHGFFFEKKNQKTFHYKGVGLLQPALS